MSDPKVKKIFHSNNLSVVLKVLEQNILEQDRELPVNKNDLKCFLMSVHSYIFRKYFEYLSNEGFQLIGLVKSDK